jgi:hypothetical protein
MADNKLKPPLAGLVYGQIIYWGVMLGSLVVIAGSILAFITRDNYVSVSYWLSAVWDAKTPSQIWEGATGSLPMSHWYFRHLMTGDGLTAAGISLAVFSVVPALFLSAFILFKEGEQLYGFLGLLCGIIVLTGVLGLIPIG